MFVITKMKGSIDPWSTHVALCSHYKNLTYRSIKNTQVASTGHTFKRTNGHYKDYRLDLEKLTIIEDIGRIIFSP
jgi:hypothetical protein